MTEGYAKPVEITAMASGSAEPALDYVATEFERQTGHKVKISYHYDLELCDVLVMSQETLERPPNLSGYNDRVEPDRFLVARNAGVGIAVRRGARVPDVSTDEAVLQAALDAERVLLTKNHVSGMHMERFFRRHGVWDEVFAKVTYGSIGQALVERLLAGQGNEVMFLALSRMRATNDDRLNILGPLPATMQHYQDFFAVPTKASTHKEVARQFARFVGGPGRQIFLQNGFY